MPDARAPLRSLPFPVVAAALGWDVTKYKRSKQDFVGPCPIHGSKNNQNCFRYHDSGKFHCFSCSAKGSGAIDLVKLARQYGFQEAVSFLEPLSAVSPPQPPAKEKALPTSNSDATELKPYKGSYEKFAVPSAWLDARVPNKAIREKYGIFCYDNPARKSAYSGRVMIPVRDVDGQLFGYLGRCTTVSSSEEVERTPKYLFPRDLPKSEFLFGAYELRQHLLSLGTGRSVYQHVFLVESPFCVLKFASLGLPALSPFGWSVSQAQLDCLATITRGIVYLPDRNKADQISQVALGLSNRTWLRCPPLPAGIDDPEQMTKEQILALTR